MNVAEAANVEVAEGDTREGHKGGVGPVVVLDHPLHDVEAVDRELSREQLVQEEQLSNDIYHVKHLCHDIKHHQIRPEPATHCKDNQISKWNNNLTRLRSLRVHVLHGICTTARTN